VQVDEYLYLQALQGPHQEYINNWSPAVALN